VKEALKLDRTPIRGRPMFVSKCDPNKSTRSSAFKYSSTLEKNKLFVKGMIYMQNSYKILFSLCFSARFSYLFISYLFN